MWPNCEITPVSQAENTFESITPCLTAAGAKFEDIVKINYYASDLSNTANYVASARSIRINLPRRLPLWCKPDC